VPGRCTCRDSACVGFTRSPAVCIVRVCVHMHPSSRAGHKTFVHKAVRACERRGGRSAAWQGLCLVCGISVWCGVCRSNAVQWPFRARVLGNEKGETERPTTCSIVCFSYPAAVRTCAACAQRAAHPATHSSAAVRPSSPPATSRGVRLPRTRGPTALSPCTRLHATGHKAL
jgi:hypothetical protein